MSKSFALILLVVCQLVACSTPPTVPPAEEINLNGVTLSYSRSTMGRTDFEQYKLTDHTLYRECGRILGGRYSPQEQEVISIDESAVAKIKENAWQLRRFVREKNAPFATPGNNTGLFDPGQLSLSLEFPDDIVNIKTSFDSIAIPSAPREHRTSELALALRKSVPTPPCGRDEFYGLGRRRIE